MGICELDMTYILYGVKRVEASHNFSGYCRVKELFASTGSYCLYSLEGTKQNVHHSEFSLTRAFTWACFISFLYFQEWFVSIAKEQCFNPSSSPRECAMLLSNLDYCAMLNIIMAQVILTLSFQNTDCHGTGIQ